HEPDQQMDRVFQGRIEHRYLLSSLTAPVINHSGTKVSTAAHATASGHSAATCLAIVHASCAGLLTPANVLPISESASAAQITQYSATLSARLLRYFQGRLISTKE